MADRSTTPVAREVESSVPRDESPAPAASKKAAAGFMAWLPLAVTIFTMPVLAYATTQFVLLPKIKHAMTQPAAPAAESGQSPSKDNPTGTGKEKILVPLPKILVNVKGTMMTRYLTMSMTLVGSTPDFKDRVTSNLDHLKDLATGTLMNKTITDLEQPDSRNNMRAELLTVFNTALGGPAIQEIYITEQAIQ
jgi:flagellar basal body-associated protein FliL